jgi:hypothetical protein
VGNDLRLVVNQEKSAMHPITSRISCDQYFAQLDLIAKKAKIVNSIIKIA